MPCTRTVIPQCSISAGDGRVRLRASGQTPPLHFLGGVGVLGALVAKVVSRCRYPFVGASLRLARGQVLDRAPTRLRPLRDPFVPRTRDQGFELCSFAFSAFARATRSPRTRSIALIIGRRFDRAAACLLDVFDQLSDIVEP